MLLILMTLQELTLRMGNAPTKKYESYHLEVDPSQDNKANQIKLFSFQRPHMRAFHCAWWSYHVAFLMW